MSLSAGEKKKMIDRKHSKLSVSRQCELLSLSKGALYYQPVGENAYNLKLMNLLDEQYTRTPFYGSRRMTAYLNSLGHAVNRKRVGRLMSIMGLEAIYPKPNLSRKRHERKIYPYLLKGLEIDRPNQVWSSDITYIRLKGGFAYLAAVIDWYSRYVLSWRLSNSLEVCFCLEALEDALAQGCPDIFNTDQGSQFTSEEFTGRLNSRGIKISMDSRGRALDNIFVERLWRSVKYEEVYLNDYQTVRDSKRRLGRYFIFYNTERFHQSLDYKVPIEVHFQDQRKQ